MDAFSYASWVKDQAEDLAGEFRRLEVNAVPVTSSAWIVGILDREELIQVFCHPKDEDVQYLKDFKYPHREL